MPRTTRRRSVKEKLRWAFASLLATTALGLFGAIGAAPAAGQATGTIRGTVTESAARQPIVGVQISIPGTRLGGLTDAQGVFRIANVPAGETRVRVESIGYRAVEQTVTVTAGQTAVLDVSLQQSAIGLDEIVVTGTARGTQKREIGNSVSSINAGQITEATAVTNVQQILQGRTAGVTMLSSTGVVGGSTKIRIRGAGSITAGNDPVFYVDGIRVQSGTLATSGNSTSQGLNYLEMLNPADIESIEIIKGPAAATLYGAEAAAGVVQIITKKGRPAEGMQWNASFDYGHVDWATDRITNYWLCEDSQIQDPVRYPGCSVFTTSTPREERVLVDHPLDPDQRSLGVQKQYADKGWTEDYPCLFPQQQPCNPQPLRTGILRNLNLAVRGGGESYNFYVSGEKNDENGTFFNNFNNRLSGRANFGFVPSPKANFNVNVGYAQLDQQVPQADNSSNSVLRNAFRGQAGGPLGQYLPGFRNFMPEFSNKFNDEFEQERLTMGLTANYNPFGWWLNRLTIGVDRSDAHDTSISQIDQTGVAPFGSTSATGSVDIDYDLIHFWTVDYAGTVTARLSDNYSSNFSAGMQLNKRRRESHGISGNGLVANQLNLISASANRNASQSFSEQTSLGFYLQEEVGWRDRLYATAAVRVDDNSAFGRDFSLVVYPKAQVSYIISEEPFFNVGWVDQLKLRGAWGQAGNAPNPFSADRTYSTGRTTVGDVAVNTLGTSAFGNPDLKAETGQELEMGFDASLFKGRLGAEFTFYTKTTKDALLSVSDPPSSGWTGSHLVNVGEIRNRGLELSLNAGLVNTPSLRWDLVASASTNHNKLISFGRDAQGNPVLVEDRFGEFLSVQRHREGFPLGGYWSTDVKRDANGVPILNASGQAAIVDCVWDPEQPELCQEEYLGPSLPTRSVGLTNTLQIMNTLQLYAFVDYQGGHWQWCAICSVNTRIDRNTRAINDPNLSAVEKARLLSLQTKEFLYRADFIKLRELAATYTLPRTLTSRFGFSRAAVTLSGRNLWMWTKYEGASDPEVAFSSTSAFGRTDYAAIPMQRRLMMSFNFSF